MPNITIERPILFLAAILSPFILIIGRSFFRNILSLSLSLGAPGGESFKTSFKTSMLIRFTRFLESAGIAVLLLAASGPELISNSFVYLDRGADILFVIDASPSMAGMDIGGQSRFNAACTLLRDFAEKRPADAIGLVALGNDAALLVPPTTDRTSLFLRLESLKIGELGDGTALGMGLSVAALHLRNSAAPRKAIVLITDGENNAGALHPETIAASLVDAGISLYVIAVGSTGEVPIDYVDPYTHIRRTGSFDSRFNPEALRNIAHAAAGVFIPAPSSDAFIEAISRISKAEMTVSRAGVRGKRTAVHNTLILVGLLLCSSAFFVRKIFLGALL